MKNSTEIKKRMVGFAGPKSVSVLWIRIRYLVTMLVHEYDGQKSFASLSTVSLAFMIVLRRLKYMFEIRCFSMHCYIHEFGSSWSICDPIHPRSTS